MAKFRVATNHGTFNFDAVDSDDARRQAKNLTYGPTSVYSVDALNDKGETGHDVALRRAQEAKDRSLHRY